MSKSQQECWRCDGTGKIIDSKGNKKKCHVCSGSGYLRKKTEQNKNNADSDINKNNNTNNSNNYSGCYFIFVIGIIIALYFISCSGPDECNLCKGNKQVACYTCNGTGVAKCKDCKGKTFGWFKCARCKGTKKHDCFTCNKNGNLTCYRCNGNGEDPKTDSTPEPEPPPLPKLPPYIVYINGWQPGGIDKEGIENQKNILREMFPKSQLDTVDWHCTGSFGESIAEADWAAKQIAEKISNLEKHERENIILVGHSLGGRMSIRIMAHLANYNMPVKAGYFLAAAIDCDDKDIKPAIENSLEKNVIIFDESDGALMGYELPFSGRGPALGRWGYNGHYFTPKKLIQYVNQKPTEFDIPIAEIIAFIVDPFITGPTVTAISIGEKYVKRHYAEHYLTLLKEKEGRR